MSFQNFLRQLQENLKVFSLFLEAIKEFGNNTTNSGFAENEIYMNVGVQILSNVHVVEVQKREITPLYA